MIKLQHMIGLALMAGLTGCASMNRPVSDPNFAPTYPTAAQTAPAPATGSLYHAGRQVTLFRDRTAHRVGDILTVTLQETTSATKSATTTTKKADTLSMPSPTLFGGPVLAGATGQNILSNSASSSNNFSGQGSSDQSNTLSGTIAVTVARVLPNGDLLVRGQKILSLNQGKEYIRLSGIVRPDDIGSDNTVLSTQIANARISYGGSGVVDNSNRMGWLARFFNSVLWPL